MRSDNEMYNLILSFAEECDNIRAVYMNGSRTNPNVSKDIFQDFDIVYVVKETEPFINDKSWIQYFGDIAVMQEPDNSELFTDTSDNSQTYGYLMQFKDGTRIDLTFQSEAIAKVNYLSDKLTMPLLDKDALLPEIPVPSDEDYHVVKPTEGQYRSCCNEFWWVSTYIAKGLWRKEILFAMDHLNLYVRPMLLKMLQWKIGIDTNFAVSVGKNNKYMDKYLDSTSWERLLKTYTYADVGTMWKAVFAMCDLFTDTSKEVGIRLGYSYDTAEDERTREYLNKVKNNEL